MKSASDAAVVVPHPALAGRSAGVLLHPTSLPGRYGAGDVGPAADRFVDDLGAAGQRWWQMLPVNPPSRPPGNSPYSAPSAMASSPWLISPELLVGEGLVGKGDLPPAARDARPARADFGHARAVREAVLRKAYAGEAGREIERSGEFRAFRDRNADWLTDYCLFAALSERFGYSHWIDWPEGLRARRRRALAEAERELAGEVAFHAFGQFLFDRQWRRLRGHARRRGVGLIGDVPIFVSHNSADVWAHPELFVLDRGGRPTVVSGAPPDFFSATGQKWGHPHYRWAAHRKSGFGWWVARFGRLFEYFDCVRIDHFLGFYRAWAVPAAACDAMGGRWVKSPGDELFAALNEKLGRPCIIAEDLGTVVPAALALRDRYGLPGMRVLHFGFGGEDDYHLPHRYPPHSVAYTGTHDNDTTVGWFDGLRAADDGQLGRAVEYVGLRSVGGRADAWPFIRAVASSAANTVIVPVQDLLGLGAESRMNVPGTGDDNWAWRMRGPLPKAVIGKLRRLTEATGRVREA